MIDIPMNDKAEDVKSKLATAILKRLQDSGYASIYKCDVPCSLDDAKDVMRQFVRKGYYAKVVYFVESHKGYQMIVVSKTPLKETCARMVYSEFIM